VNCSKSCCRVAKAVWALERLLDCSAAKSEFSACEILLAAGAVVMVMMDLAGSLLLLKILLDVGVVLLRGRDVAVLQILR
jgi:hypothetical protein